MSKGWLQFVLVAGPVLMLIGSWLSLKRLSALHSRPAQQEDEEADGRGD
jgi:hypothetical protein